MCDKCDGSGRHRLKAWDNSYICQRCMGTGGDPVLGLSYAGVGSRVAPLPIIREIENIGMMLALRGLILRSGMHARPVPRVENTASADEAFERGCVTVAGSKIIRCSPGKASQVIMGDYGDDPARFVICYARDGEAVEPLAVAAEHGIPVLNLALSPVAELWPWMEAL